MDTKERQKLYLAQNLGCTEKVGGSVTKEERWDLCFRSIICKVNGQCLEHILKARQSKEEEGGLTRELKLQNGRLWMIVCIIIHKKLDVASLTPLYSKQE